MIYKLAVFGNPIAHSRSPEIHQLFAEQHGMSIDYQRVLVPVGEFSEYARQFLAQGGHGFNVTVPFKTDAFHFAEECSRPAALAESVNTISVSNNTIKGDSTDGAGMVQDICRNLGWTVKAGKVLVLGAGGAVKGVLANLLNEGPEQVDILNRTVEKAEAIVSVIDDSRVRAVTIDKLASDYSLIINGTSAGLLGKSLALPEHIIHGASHCYDMSYNTAAGAGQTGFLVWCRDTGAAQCADGLGMLVEQAAEAFKLWFHCEVDTHPVIESLRES